MKIFREREIRNMFVRTNILILRFSKCSLSVKTTLFKSYCICMYNVALWKFFKKGSMNRFHSCYNKFVKAFFGCKRYNRLTKVLMDTGLPSFNTIISNCKYVSETRWFTSCNMLESTFRSSIWWFTECVACYWFFSMCLVSLLCVIWAKCLK